MATVLSALQKAALDFMIEAKKADQCFLAVCLNDNQAVANVGRAVVNDQAAGPAPANNWAAVYDALQHAGDCMNHQTFVGMGIGNVAQNAAQAVAGGPTPPSEAAESAPAGISLEDLIKLRHGLR